MLFSPPLTVPSEQYSLHLLYKDQYPSELSFLYNIALMGPSGAGKTKLMNIMGCLDRATQGEYFLDGNEISDYPEKEKARLRNEKFGFVVQDFALINEMTVYENVRLPLRYSRKRLKEERIYIENILKDLEIEDKKEIRV